MSVRLYALVSEQTQKAVELYESRGAAEATLAEVRADDPGLARVLHVDLTMLARLNVALAKARTIPLAA